MNKQKINRKGTSNFINVAVAFGVGIVGFVIVVILLQTLRTGSDSATLCPSTGYTYNATADNCYLNTNGSVKSSLSFAANITNDGLVFSDNFSSQWGLAGTILGYVLVLGILALIGIGGYMGWQKVRGSR
jgi:TRAP-type C4-dicarboxylate transport system permease small subunit